MTFNLQTNMQITIPVLKSYFSTNCLDKNVYFYSRLQKEKIPRSQQFENVYAYFVWKLGSATYMQGLIFCLWQ